MHETPFKNLLPIDPSSRVLPSSFSPFPKHWKAYGRTVDSPTLKKPLFQSILAKEGSEFKNGLWVVHGIQEHFGRYFHFPAYLNDHFDFIVGVDHQGHGRSNGTRGHVEEFDYYAEDQSELMIQLLTELEMSERTSQLHLLGHSMGGLIALRMLMNRNSLPVQSVTLSNPVVRIKAEIPTWKKAAGNVLNVVWGSFQVPYEVNAEGLSHDPKVKDNVENDALMVDRASARFYKSFTQRIDETFSEEVHLSKPVQFLISVEDQIVDPLAVEDFAKRLDCNDKEIKKYKGFFHEVFNEVSKERAFEDVIEWAKKHS